MNNNVEVTLDVIVDALGTPALLEGCAEECAELAQACLKLARKLRGDNPTPANEKEIIANISEEMADVLVCMDTLVESGLISAEGLDSTKLYKINRWYNRILEKEKEN